MCASDKLLELEKRLGVLARAEEMRTEDWEELEQIISELEGMVVGGDL